MILFHLTFNNIAKKVSVQRKKQTAEGRGDTEKEKTPYRPFYSRFAVSTIRQAHSARIIGAEQERRKGRGDIRTWHSLSSLCCGDKSLSANCCAYKM